MGKIDKKWQEKAAEELKGDNTSRVTTLNRLTGIL